MHPARFRAGGLALACALLAGLAAAAPPAGSTIAFTLSMSRPAAHYFHVQMRCKGFPGDFQDVKMPVWQPGYYRIMDFARNVIDFAPHDAATGHPLAWDKIAKNVWRVRTGGSRAFTVRYDVYAFAGHNPAESYLDDSRAFVSPTGIFMYIAGQIQHPATVTLDPYAGWSRTSTGLDRVQGPGDTLYAPDFDVLYDSPILMGNQEVHRFEVRGVPHFLAIEHVPGVDRQKMIADLKRMIKSASAVIGEIPYAQYTFLLMGEGRGGIEHANSSADMFDGESLATPAGYRRWLSYIAHEYFHLYNVKRIRPIALGPFDYDKENYTHMLWVSEGITVYYEDLILERAGLLTRDQYFDRLRASIAPLENGSGHRFESATEASFDTWSDFFARDENMSNTTISYYDKGAVLGLLLDLSIRHATGDRKSLDDVMRYLYATYYKEKRRGFTDAEFREACESVAGTGLGEIFEYASTTKAIDYPKYLAYAGLDIDTAPKDSPGGYLGADVNSRDGAAVIRRVEWDSPAQRAGLSALDEILAIDGVRITAQNLDSVLLAKAPRDGVKVLVSRNGRVREIDATLGKKSERSYRISASAHPDALQSEILEGWLRLN
jgi:predicted metalloprotease with PDZ domain